MYNPKKTSEKLIQLNMEKKKASVTGYLLFRKEKENCGSSNADFVLFRYNVTDTFSMTSWKLLNISIANFSHQRSSQLQFMPDYAMPWSDIRYILAQEKQH